MTLRTTVWTLLSACFIVLFSTALGQGTNQPCDIKVLQDIKIASCSGNNLTSIPNDIDNDIQSLNISNNELFEIKEDAFQQIFDSNNSLLSLILNDCNLTTIHGEAFSNLTALTDLDLSNNNLATLDDEVFNNNEQLLRLYLSGNRLVEINDRVFTHLSNLEMLFLDNNRLVEISSTAFNAMVPLKTLSLNGNKLLSMRAGSISDLKNLIRLDLHDNPWKCDCHLRCFRDLIVNLKINTSLTICHDTKKSWSEMTSNDFACPPVILEWVPEMFLLVNKKATLVCKVAGDPPPTINWLYNSAILKENPKLEKYTIKQEDFGSNRWLTLTITNFFAEDRGDYVCTAENPAGTVSKTTTLSRSKKNYLFILFFLLIPLFFLVFYLCKLHKKGKEEDAEEGFDTTDKHSEKPLYQPIPKEDKGDLITNDISTSLPNDKTELSENMPNDDIKAETATPVEGQIIIESDPKINSKERDEDMIEMDLLAPVLVNQISIEELIEAEQSPRERENLRAKFFKNLLLTPENSNMNRPPIFPQSYTRSGINRPTSDYLVSPITTEPPPVPKFDSNLMNNLNVSFEIIHDAADLTSPSMDPELTPVVEEASNKDKINEMQNNIPAKPPRSSTTTSSAVTEISTEDQK